MQLARMAVQKNRLPVLHLKLRFFASHHHRDAEPGRNDCAVRGFAAGSEHNASYLAGVKPCRQDVYKRQAVICASCGRQVEAFNGTIQQSAAMPNIVTNNANIYSNVNTNGYDWARQVG